MEIYLNVTLIGSSWTEKSGLYNSAAEYNKLVFWYVSSYYVIVTYCSKFNNLYGRRAIVELIALIDRSIIILKPLHCAISLASACYYFVI